MKKALVLVLIATTNWAALAAQTPQEPNKQSPDDVLRITTELVQVDAVIAKAFIIGSKRPEKTVLLLLS